MNLEPYFARGLSVDAYVALLDVDQMRLHRLYERRADLLPEDVDVVRKAPPCHVLVITEPWCGDSLAILPVVARLFSEAGRFLRIVRRDEHPELIDQYLTNGARAIPLVIVTDEAYQEIFHWGPRPKPAQEIAVRHKEDVAEGRLDKTEVYKRIRSFYACDRGRAILSELTALFAA